MKDKIIKNWNLKMESGVHAHPLAYAIIGDNLPKNGKYTMDTNYYSSTSEDAINRFSKTPVIIGSDDKLKLVYSNANTDTENATSSTKGKYNINIPISVYDTYKELEYVANSEYLFKCSFDAILNNNNQTDVFLNVYKRTFPIFIEINDDLYYDKLILDKKIVKISLNGLEVDIDNVFSKEINIGENPKTWLIDSVYQDIIEYGYGRFQEIGQFGNQNQISGRHLSYQIMNLTKFDTKKTSIDYSSMIYDTITLTSKYRNRHLTWEQWDELRRGISSEYPLPIHIEVNIYDKVQYKQGWFTDTKDNILTKYYAKIGEITLQTFRGNTLFVKPGSKPGVGAGDMPNMFSAVDMRNDNYLSNFDVLFRVPRGAPTLVISLENSITVFKELKFIPESWYRSDCKLDYSYETLHGDRVVNKTYRHHKSDNRSDSYVEFQNFYSALNMSNFLLPAERSVMEWSYNDTI